MIFLSTTFYFSLNLYFYFFSPDNLTFFGERNGFGMFHSHYFYLFIFQILHTLAYAGCSSPQFAHLHRFLHSFLLWTGGSFANINHIMHYNRILSCDFQTFGSCHKREDLRWRHFVFSTLYPIFILWKWLLHWMSGCKCRSGYFHYSFQLLLFWHPWLPAFSVYSLSPLRTNPTLRCSVFFCECMLLFFIIIKCWQ